MLYWCMGTSTRLKRFVHVEEMAAASLDQNFKEELSAIEQCE